MGFSSNTDRSGGDSTVNHLFEFTAEILELLKNLTSILKWIRSGKLYIGENTWKTNYHGWFVGLPLFFLQPKVWKYGSLVLGKHNGKLDFWVFTRFPLRYDTKLWQTHCVIIYKSSIKLFWNFSRKLDQLIAWDVSSQFKRSPYHQSSPENCIPLDAFCHPFLKIIIYRICSKLLFYLINVNVSTSKKSN